MNCRASLVALTLFLIAMTPVATADLSRENQTLNLVCSNDDCSLSTDAAGDTMLSEEMREANLAQPVTVTLEFPMSPDQTSVSLLPSVLESMIIDFRIQGDDVGLTRPDLYIELILGASTNSWTIAAPEPSSTSTNQEVYVLENEDLDISNGRILSPDDQILLRISFDINQPVTWELYLAGNSNVVLPIEWSIDAAAANVDEPTSLTEPRPITLVGSTTFGGLMGSDVDCFRFDLDDQLSVLTVTVSWDATPLEVEQAHTIPEFWDNQGNSEDSPEIRTRYEGEIVVNEYRWSEPKGGPHTLCWTGAENHYQSYSFTGSQSIMGVGSTTPEDFSGEATWDSGTSQVGQLGESSDTSGAGIFTMGVAGIGIIIAIIGYLMPLSSPWLPRFMLPVAIILLLFGGIVSPAVSISNESPNPGEMTFEELLEQRLDRIYQGVINDDEGEFGPQWYGGFLGVAAGERLQLMLTIESTHPLGDGRWQIEVEELDEVDLDRWVFGKLNDGRLSEENEVRFILRSGRLLALDLILLEALLIVDEEPRGNVLHIDWQMVTDSGMGSFSSPAWVSRPDTVTASDWNKVTNAVKPELLSVSFCDCGIDAMELSIRSNDVYVNDLISPGGIESSNGLIPHDFWVAVLGITVLVCAGFVEKERREKGMALAEELLYSR
ncbi:MAG: hypothetical protein P8Q90_04650 [Candidatus Thalassarchaeaceae archaeon]|nr:hypothetical protein [Candidatus Thalassarchaeaceae archaeon]